jgi:hypothetical protein
VLDFRHADRAHDLAGDLRQIEVDEDLVTLLPPPRIPRTQLAIAGKDPARHGVVELRKELRGLAGRDLPADDVKAACQERG